MPAETGIYLALGSNLGDRLAHLRAAVARLAQTGAARVTAGSALYATRPVGISGAQEFFNAVVEVESALEPADLLRACLQVESAEGRVRSEAAGWTSRTLDIDLLAHGSCECSQPELTLPHPGITARAFVLWPWCELAPERKIRGRTVAQWADAVGSEGIARVLGTERWWRD